MKALGTWGPILIGASMVLYYGFIHRFIFFRYSSAHWLNPPEGNESLSIFLCTGILSLVAGLVALAVTEDRN